MGWLQTRLASVCAGWFGGWSLFSFCLPRDKTSTQRDAAARYENNDSVVEETCEIVIVDSGNKCAAEPEDNGTISCDSDSGLDNSVHDALSNTGSTNDLRVPVDVLYKPAADAVSTADADHESSEKATSCLQGDVVQSRDHETSHELVVGVQELLKQVYLTPAVEPSQYNGDCTAARVDDAECDPETPQLQPAAADDSKLNSVSDQISPATCQLIAVTVASLDNCSDDDVAIIDAVQSSDTTASTPDSVVVVEDSGTDTVANGNDEALSCSPDVFNKASDENCNIVTDNDEGDENGNGADALENGTAVLASANDNCRTCSPNSHVDRELTAVTDRITVVSFQRTDVVGDHTYSCPSPTAEEPVVSSCCDDSYNDVADDDIQQCDIVSKSTVDVQFSLSPDFVSFVEAVDTELLSDSVDTELISDSATTAGDVPVDEVTSSSSQIQRPVEYVDNEPLPVEIDPEMVQLHFEPMSPSSPTNANFLDGFHGVGVFDQSEWFDEFEATLSSTDVTLKSSSRDFIKSPPPYAAAVCEVMPSSAVNAKPGVASQFANSSSFGYRRAQFSVVPSSCSDVSKVIDDALEVFWQCRRYGESPEAVLPPQSFYLPHELLDGVESTSQRVFKRMIFDLVGEIFQEIYQEDDHLMEPTNSASDEACRTRAARRFSTGSEQTPTTIDGVRPVIHSHVTRCLGLTNHTRTQIKSNKWLLGRKTTSTVIDHMLVEDLALEEKGWIDYDLDVSTRKLEIADFLFEALLYDTVYAVVNVERLRHQDTLADSTTSS